MGGEDDQQIQEEAKEQPPEAEQIVEQEAVALVDEENGE